MLLTLGEINPMLTCLETSKLVQMENESTLDKLSSTNNNWLHWKWKKSRDCKKLLSFTSCYIRKTSQMLTKILFLVKCSNKDHEMLSFGFVFCLSCWLQYKTRKILINKVFRNFSNKNIETVSLTLFLY